MTVKPENRGMKFTESKFKVGSFVRLNQRGLRCGKDNLVSISGIIVKLSENLIDLAVEDGSMDLDDTYGTYDM